MQTAKYDLLMKAAIQLPYRVEVPFSQFFNPTSRDSLRIVTSAGLPYPLEKFTTVVVKGAYISQLFADFFAGLYFVKKLVLDGCNVSEIEPGAFRGLNFLSDLYITGNNISSLPDGMTSGLNSLRILNLQTNNIQHVGKQAFLSTALEELDLSGNAIRVLHPITFDSLLSLKVLNMDSNQIQKFPEGIFGNLVLLRELNIANNPDRVLSNIFTAHSCCSRVCNSGSGQYRMCTI